MQFQIKTLAQHGSMPFQDYKQFIELCDKSSIEDKAKLVVFYMHNLTLTNINVWDANENMGDMKLMALVAWMTHEETKVEEVKKVMSREKNNNSI